MKLLWWTLGLLALIAIALLSGKYSIDYRVLLTGAPAGADQDLDTAKAVILHSRLPRVLAALVIGSCLSAAGAAYQGIFRNPMVSPDMLGASAGSAFGAALGILMGYTIRGVEMVSFGAGITAVALTLVISSSVSRSRSPLVLILSGILVSTVFTSLLSLVKFLADPYSKLPDITFWLLGSLAAVSMSDALFVSATAGAGLVPLFILRWRINLLSLTDDEARSLGVSTRVYQVIMIACATLITSSAVAVCGLIGWVGLVVPHIVRLVFGPNYGTLMTASLVVGGMYLLAVDTVARQALSLEVPLGIPTAMIGAPFLVYLMRRAEREWA